MQLLIERCIAIGRASMTRLKQWNWWVWAVAIAVLGTLWLAFQNGYLSLVAGVTGWVWRELSLAAAKPMGFGGLIVLGGIGVFITLLLGSAWIETSPFIQTVISRIRKRPAQRVAPTWEERQHIQNIRMFWNLYGEKAVDSLGGLANETRDRLRKANYLAPLLDPLLSRFGEQARSMILAVADDSVAGLAEVQNCVHAVMRTYVEIIGWLIPIHEHDVNVRMIEWRFDQWRESHEKMKDKLTELLVDPAHKQQIISLANLKSVDALYPAQTLKSMADALVEQENANVNGLLPPEPSGLSNATPPS